MMNPESTSRAEQKAQPLDDNARKFIIRPLDNEFLDAQRGTNYMLVTDWLETNEEDETKVVQKQYTDGTEQLLLIKKVTTDGVRTSQKTQLTPEEYADYLNMPQVHVEKRRHEFTTMQNDIKFAIKYDEFVDSALRVIEVEGATNDEQALFNPTEFPGQPIEVTGDSRYYGYRVTDML